MQSALADDKTSSNFKIILAVLMPTSCIFCNIFSQKLAPINSALFVAENINKFNVNCDQHKKQNEPPVPNTCLANSYVKMACRGKQ